MTCMLGYATASAVGQNLEGQLAALSAEGVDPRRVFTDKLSESPTGPGAVCTPC